MWEEEDCGGPRGTLHKCSVLCRESEGHGCVNGDGLNFSIVRTYILHVQIDDASLDRREPSPFDRVD